MPSGSGDQRGFDDGVGVLGELGPDGAPASSKRTKRPVNVLAASRSCIPRAARASSLAWRTLQCSAASAISASVSAVATAAKGASTSRVRRPAERAPKSAGSSLDLLGREHQCASRASADLAALAQPGCHRQSAVAPEGLGGGERRYVAQHGVLVDRDGSLMGLHALGQSGRTGVPAPCTAEGACAQA